MVRKRLSVFVYRFLLSLAIADFRAVRSQEKGTGTEIDQRTVVQLTFDPLVSDLKIKFSRNQLELYLNPLLEV